MYLILLLLVLLIFIVHFKVNKKYKCIFLQRIGYDESLFGYAETVQIHNLPFIPTEGMVIQHPPSQSTGRITEVRWDILDKVFFCDVKTLILPREREKELQKVLNDAHERGWTVYHLTIEGKEIVGNNYTLVNTKDPIIKEIYIRN